MTLRLGRVCVAPIAVTLLTGFAATSTVEGMRGSARRIGFALTAAVVVIGCGGSDDDASADSTPASSAPAVSSATPATTTPVTETTAAPATTAPPATTPVTTPTTTSASTAATTPDTAAATTFAVTIPSEPTSPPGDGPATAVVEVGDERFEFRVTQCLFDRPSAFGDQLIEMTLDGVPPDTPGELIEPLLGAIDPDTDLLPLIEPVLEYGPALTVSRFEGAGDYLVVYDLADIEYVSDRDPLSPDARFLSFPDGDSGIPIAGATTSGGIPMAIAATCP